MAVVALLSGPAGAAEKEYAVSGMVLSVDPAANSFTVSHERIEGFMDAMTMHFEVRQPDELREVASFEHQLRQRSRDVGALRGERH